MNRLSAFSLAFALLATPALADNAAYTLNIKDHKFEPSRLEVPAGKPFVLNVKNLDPTPEEFESHDLKREKIIAGGKEAVIKIGALKPGEYKFFGEFNEATAQGVIVVK